MPYWRGYTNNLWIWSLCRMQCRVNAEFYVARKVCEWENLPIIVNPYCSSRTVFFFPGFHQLFLYLFIQNSDFSSHFWRFILSLTLFNYFFMFVLFLAFYLRVCLKLYLLVGLLLVSAHYCWIGLYLLIYLQQIIMLAGIRVP